ncbi:probable mannitol dehydrogenase [Pistacia vera]|uniref:probable mannitol dehydrogenase n=1 Tax=Pistacia vera TaxID=55513 RepID=UPI001263B4ED|nr:probable mannitol dehydrogenase [Pistacia vera]
MSELQEENSRQIAFGWAATDSSGILHPFHFTRRANGHNDMTIKILYCGICHSDLHLIKNDFGIFSYPIVPGHEIVGVVTQVGSKVQKFEVQEKAGVGGIIGSCGSYHQCQNELENYCPKRIHTSTIFDDGGVAPLLGAGITVFSPMKFYGLEKPGMHVGVVGLGGLGHLAVKFAKALGMKVTVISTSPGKKNEAIQHLEADSFIVSYDMKQIYEYDQERGK